MKLSEDLLWRGLIKDKTFDDIGYLDTPKSFYLGIDASADSMTIGNLAVILLARRLSEAGWKAVLLAGGATTLVGDPGGKNEERELMSKDQIAANIEGVKKQIERLFAGHPHELVNNLDWFADVGYLDFLRDVGKHYSMTELLQRDFVASRIGGSGISYAEFSYSLLQGYDFWWLFKTKGVELQIGASDQWGNMLSGVPLVRKKEGAMVHAFCMPLVVNKETGAKFGKSEKGAIWLDEPKTSVYDFYQFWINTPDDEVENFLKIFTFLDKAEIEEIINLHSSDPSKRGAQRRLADAVTVIVHGEEGKELARTHADAITSGSLSSSASVSPSASLPQNVVKLPDGISIINALVETGLASSNSDARRTVDEGGVYINNEPTKLDHLIASDFPDGILRLRRGKKLGNSVLIELK